MLWRRLDYDFLLLWLASYFSYFLLPYPGMFIFFVFLRLCSSHLLLSASTYFRVRVRVLSSCVICFLPHLGIPLLLFVHVFRSSYLLGRLLCKIFLGPKMGPFASSVRDFIFQLPHAGVVSYARLWKKRKVVVGATWCLGGNG